MKINLTFCFFENPAALHEIRAWENLKFKNITYKNVVYARSEPFGNFCIITYVVRNEKDDTEIVICLERIIQYEHDEETDTWNVHSAEKEIEKALANILDISFDSGVSTSYEIIDNETHGKSFRYAIMEEHFKIEFYKLLWFGKMEFDLNELHAHYLSVAQIVKQLWLEIGREPLPTEITAVLNKLRKQR